MSNSAEHQQRKKGEMGHTKKQMGHSTAPLYTIASGIRLGSLSAPGRLFAIFTELERETPPKLFEPL